MSAPTYTLRRGHTRGRHHVELEPYGDIGRVIRHTSRQWTAISFDGRRITDLPLDASTALRPPTYATKDEAVQAVVRDYESHLRARRARKRIINGPFA